MPESRSRAADADKAVLIFLMQGDGGRFVVLDTSCDDHGCRALHLIFVEIDADDRPMKGGRRINASLDRDTWREFPIENLSPADQRVITAFVADLDDQSRTFLRNRFDASKDAAGRIASYAIPSEEVLAGTLVSYVNVVTGGHSVRSGGDACGFSFVHAGTTYMIEDFYCPNPECDCKEASLVFARIQETPEGKVLADCFRATWRLSGSPRVDEASGCSKSVAREVLSAWRKDDPGLTDTFHRRYRQIKDVGRRSLAGARCLSVGGPTPFRSHAGSERKAGRNAPCPCGSGRKYKRCCGRTG